MEEEKDQLKLIVRGVKFTQKVSPQQYHKAREKFIHSTHLKLCARVLNLKELGVQSCRLCTPRLSEIQNSYYYIAQE